MQTRRCFHQISETGVLFSCFICEASLWCVFTFVDPRHHIATSYTWPSVLHHRCAHRSRPLPPSHFLHLRLHRHRGQGSQEAVTIFPQTQSHRCQLGDWFSLPPSFSFPLFFWPYPLFILSISPSPALTSGINRAKLIPSFSRIMNASVVMQQRPRWREKRAEQVNM